MKNNSSKPKVLLPVICVLVMLPSLFCISQKTILHVDEIWTYALSNSTEGPYLFLWRSDIGDPEEQELYIAEGREYSGTVGGFFKKWHTGDEFIRYVTVQDGERFNYKSVLYNQSCDVHPPLYYLSVHTICSLFPDHFSKWYAAILNLVFLVGSTCVLFRTVLHIGFSSGKAALTVLLWGLSRAGLSDAIFLRMYMMLTFWTLLALYLHAKLFRDQNIMTLCSLFFVNLAGFLTQYYYYVFCFFLTAVFCIAFAVRRRLKFSMVYGFSVLCSVAAAFAAFPAVFRHVFHGAYSGSTSALGKHLHRIFDWASLVLTDYSGIGGTGHPVLTAAVWYAIIALLLIGVIVLSMNKRLSPVLKTKVSELFGKRPPIYWMFMIATISTCCVLSVVSPRMLLFQDRYFFNLFPILAIYIVDLLSLYCSVLIYAFNKAKYKPALLIVCILAMIFGSNTLERNNYRDYRENKTSLQSVLKNEACFLVMSQDYMIHSYADEFRMADRVYVDHHISDDICKEINSFPGEKAYILIQSGSENTQLVYQVIDAVEYETIIVDNCIKTSSDVYPDDTLLLVDYNSPRC